MKIIGVTGKYGSGKTTLSNILSKKLNAPIIYMDYVLDDLKKNKILSKITQDADYKEHKSKEQKMINPKLSDFIYSNYLVLQIYRKVRSNIINKILNKQVKQYKDNNTQMLIIEGIDLIDSEIINNLDLLVLVNAPYNSRMQRITKRDGFLDTELAAKREKQGRKNIINKINRKVDFNIRNDKTIEELEEAANYILEEIKKEEITPEEKFRKENKLATKIKSITKTKQDKGINRENDEKIH